MAALLLGCLVVFHLANAVPWFAAYELTDAEKDSFFAMGCYRGAYGLSEDLSLFNCLSKPDLKPFVEAPFAAPLCVIELNPDHFQDDLVHSTIVNSSDSQILWTGHNELIVGAKDLSSQDYPSACFRSTYPRKSMRNAIVVPGHAWHKPTPVETQKVSDPDPNISTFLNGVSSSQLQSFVTSLSNYNTRLSTSAEANSVANWLRTQLQNYGFTVSLSSFRSGYSPNVIATKAGSDTSRFVYLGAHYDSRSIAINDPAARAPGADDDGSGSAMLLEFARNVQSSGIQTQYTLQLNFWSGEEQGLYGSDDQATKDRNANKNILGYYNADMIGYQCGSSIVLTFDSRSVTNSLTNTCKNMASDYVPGFAIGDNSGCCSDNESYYSQGYPTVSFFECPGSTVDNPNYHRQSDLPSTLNYNQLTAMSKLIYACALTQAGVTSIG